LGAGRLIAIEGLDGAGTTTQAALLCAWLASEGTKVHLTREPSRGPVGNLLRLILERRLVLPGRSRAGQALEPPMLALLFAADRLDHVAAEILPPLKEGWVVVTDRYVMSSLAYQGTTCDPEFVERINAQAPAPDLTILLDVPVAVCRARIAASRRGADLFEDAEQLTRVRKRYLALARDGGRAHARTVVVDGDRPKARVAAAVRRAVEAAFGGDSPRGIPRERGR
jgi:dTMP kinase